MARQSDRSIRTRFAAWISAVVGPLPGLETEDDSADERHEAEADVVEEAGPSTRGGSGEFPGWDTMIIALTA